MHSALIRILVGVGVGLGLTLTSATTAATAAPAFSDRMVAQAAGPDCSAQAAALSRARNNYGQRMRVFKQARNAVLKAQRAEKRAKTRKAKRAKRGAVCKVSYRARAGSRRLTGRLMRDDQTFAGGKRKVRAGRRGTIALTARRRPRAGRYTLVLTFRNRAGKATVVSKQVRVR
jgi:hypothetical protein